jgi:hypothetical protein
MNIKSETIYTQGQYELAREYNKLDRDVTQMRAAYLLLREYRFDNQADILDGVIREISYAKEKIAEHLIQELGTEFQFCDLLLWA